MGAAASVVEAHGFETAFAKADTDGSGKLDRHEFEAAARSVTGFQEPGAADAVFKELDVDGDGVVSLDELVKACVREAKKRSASPSRSQATLKALSLAVNARGSPQNYTRVLLSLTVSGVLPLSSCGPRSGLAEPERGAARVCDGAPNPRQAPGRRQAAA